VVNKASFLMNRLLIRLHIYIYMVCRTLHRCHFSYFPSVRET